MVQLLCFYSQLLAHAKRRSNGPMPPGKWPPLEAKQAGQPKFLGDSTRESLRRCVHRGSMGAPTSTQTGRQPPVPAVLSHFGLRHFALQGRDNATS